MMYNFFFFIKINKLSIHLNQILHSTLAPFQASCTFSNFTAISISSLNALTNSFPTVLLFQSSKPQSLGLKMQSFSILSLG